MLKFLYFESSSQNILQTLKICCCLILLKKSLGNNFRWFQTISMRAVCIIFIFRRAAFWEFLLVWSDLIQLWPSWICHIKAADLERLQRLCWSFSTSDFCISLADLPESLSNFMKLLMSIEAVDSFSRTCFHRTLTVLWFWNNDNVKNARPGIIINYRNFISINSF